MSLSEQSKITLVADAGDEHTHIQILDGNRTPINLDGNLGYVSVDLDPGVYSVQFRNGTEVIEEFAVLQPDSGTQTINLDRKLQFASSAPIDDTRTTREYHQIGARNVSLSPPLLAAGHAGGSQLMVFVRNAEAISPCNPAAGLTVRDLRGNEITDISSSRQRNEADKWVATHLALDPGPYRLRLETGRGLPVEQMTYLCPGWQTQVFLLTQETDDAETRAALHRMSVLMAQLGTGFEPNRPDLRWTEQALHALEGMGSVPGTQRSEMFNQKFFDPMLGIYAALLHLRRKSIDPWLLTQVFDNLTNLVGPHPDVLAIGWALCQRLPEFHDRDRLLESLEQAGGFEAPPTLLESWEHVLRATTDRPDLIVAGSLPDRIADRVIARGPWLTWRGNIQVAPKSERRRAEEEDKEERKGVMGLIVGSLKGVLVGIGRDTLRGSMKALQKGFHEHEEWRSLIESHHFTHREKRIASFVYPLLEPTLRGLVERTPALKKQILAGMENRKLDEEELVRSLGIPVGTALTTIGGLYIRLIMPQLLPAGVVLDEFVEENSRDNPVLREVLSRLDDEPTALGLRESKRSLSRLDLLYLRYRNSPLDLESVTPTAKQLAATLKRAGYVVAPDKEVTEQRLTDAAAKIRTTVRSRLDAARQQYEIAFDDEWLKGALPSPRSYKPGALFPELPPRGIRIMPAGAIEAELSDPPPQDPLTGVDDS